MKSKILTISCLVGLSIITTAVNASGNTSNVEGSTVKMSVNKETLSEKIQTLINKNNSKTQSSAASLTISILEDYQNNQMNYLVINKEEKAIFNQTIKSIFSQAQNISDEKSLNWIKEINKSAKAINAIWASLDQNPVVENELNPLSENQVELIIVL
ncbi:hypothetical protein V7S76_07370 [Aquirufa sp. ROCK2-A2]